jgi:zinc protease
MTWTSGAVVERLPNGLNLVAQRDPSAPAVAVITHVRAGFFDEPDEWQGISHVLEHMFFKGTPRRAVGKIAQETKALGGYLNASTSYDRTLYYVVLPVENLAAALDIQADALRNATLDPAELARELRVIIEEAKRKLDSPGAVAGETLHELLYDHHRIRRWRIGYEAQLAGFTAADVRGYYASRYVPSRVTVGLVGDLDPQALLDAARPFYADWKGEDRGIEAGPTEQTEPTRRVRTLRGDVTQADLVVGWRSVAALHPDSVPLDLAAAILGAGRGSRLHRALREPGVAASVSAYSYSPDEVGVFGVSASGNAAQLDPMLRGLAREVRRLRETAATADELERARTLLRVRWVRRMESFDARASALTWAVAHGGVALLDEEYDRLMTVTADEVSDVVRRQLSPEQASALAYLPTGAGEELVLDRLAEAFNAPAERPVVAPSPTVGVPGVRSRGVKGRETAGTTHYALPGADLLVRRKSGIPTTTLGLYFGRPWEGIEMAGLGALAARSSVRGAGAFDAGALALAFERLGGSLVPSVSADQAAFGATVLTERLSEASALLRLVVEEPRFLEADILAERTVLLEEAKEAADDMFRFPFQLAFRGAFGDAGYGVPAGGVVESLERFDAAMVRAHWRELTAARPTVVVVGDEEPDALADRVIAGLGGIVESPRPAGAQEGERAAWKGTGTVVVHERDKQQSAFAMLFPGPDRRATDHTAAEVWAAVASGLGGRLFEALREQRSLAYTVLGTAWARRRGGAIGVYIGTSPQREAEAREEMLKELARFAAEAPGEEELDRARNYLAGQTEVGRMSAAAVASEIADAWLSGDGLEEMEAPWDKYREVTAEEVLAVARASFDPSRRAEGVVRGRV